MKFDLSLLEIKRSLETFSRKSLRHIMVSICFGLLCTITTYYRVPLSWTPIPLSFQPLGALLSGAILGPFYGALSQVVYLASAEFSIYGSFSILYGPFAGYVWSFLPLSYISGLLSFNRKYSPLQKSIALFISYSVLVYGIGMTWLQLHLSAAGFSPTLFELIQKSFLPFFVGDLFKIGVTTFYYYQTDRGLWNQ